MQTHYMVLDSAHYRFVKKQTSPFKLIVTYASHSKGDKLYLSELNGVTGVLTGLFSEFEILKSDLIEHNSDMPSYVWLTVLPLACHSPQKSNF